MSESPQKKRKRLHSHDEHPRKKAPSDAQSVRLEMVQDVGEWSPALGNFQALLCSDITNAVE